MNVFMSGALGALIFLFSLPQGPAGEAAAKTSADEKEAVRLFNEVFRLEDLIRTEPPGYRHLDIEDKPYLTMRSSVNTAAKLKSALEKIYTKQAALQYIEHLDVIVVDKKNGEIGRMALYFYTKFVDFNSRKTKALLISSSPGRKIFKITAPLCCTGKPGDVNEFKNFIMEWEDGRWKVGNIPDSMWEPEKR